MMMKVINNFYEEYKYSNADTKDFISSVNSTIGSNINSFISPWLYSNSLPQYNIEWEYNNEKVSGYIRQIQNNDTFINNVEILIEYPNIEVLKEFEILSRNQKIEFDSTVEPINITIDPNNLILKRITK